MAVSAMAAVATTLAAALLACTCAVAATETPITPSPPTDSGPSAPAGAAGRAAAGAAERPLRILAIMTVDTMSHHLWMAPLTVALAKRGHLVESVDVAVPKEVPPTLNVTVIETAFQMTEGFQRMFEAKGFELLGLMYQYGITDTKRDLEAPALRRIIDPAYKGKFDLIIMDYLTDSFLGFAHRFDYPGVVVMSPFPGNPWLHDLKGNPAVPAVLPHAMISFPHPMTLWQRASTAAYTAFNRLLEWWFRPQVDGILRDAFGEDVPPTEELRRLVHVALVNENPVLDSPRPYVPGLIAVGGMHVQPANLSRIAADLRGWMDGAKSGFILVSFGSVAKGASMDEAKKSALLDSFRALGDIRVLWKMEPELVPTALLTANTRIEKWLPQEDILGHPNLRLFVSHCGGLSTTEAAYNGVPILGVPIMGDQFHNVEKMARIGMARRLPYADLTRDAFFTELQTMLSDPSYRSAAQRTSVLFRDQQASPLETAVWWCEYVGRHRGAPHLRSPVLDVPWAQGVLLDVLALLAAAIFALLLGVVLLARRVFCRSKDAQQEQQHAKRE